MQKPYGPTSLLRPFLVLLALATTACLLDGNRAPASRDGFAYAPARKGDWWELRTAYQPVDGIEVPADYTFRNEILDEDVACGKGSCYLAALSLRFGAASGTGEESVITTEGRAHLRKPDREATWSGWFQPAGAGDTSRMQSEFWTDISGVPPSPLRAGMTWTLKTAKTWIIRYDYRDSSIAYDTTVAVYTGEGDETVTVPAGTFRAFRVRYVQEESGEVGVLHYSREVNGLVRAVISRGDTVVSTAELQAYSR